MLCARRLRPRLEYGGDQVGVRPTQSRCRSLARTLQTGSSTIMAIATQGARNPPIVFDFTTRSFKILFNAVPMWTSPWASGGPLPIPRSRKGWPQSICNRPAPRCWSARASSIASCTNLATNDETVFAVTPFRASKIKTVKVLVLAVTELAAAVQTKVKTGPARAHSWRKERSAAARIAVPKILFLLIGLSLRAVRV